MARKTPSDSSGSLAPNSFATVQDIIGDPPAPGVATAAKLSLAALKDILEAVDTLPCVKYIAGIGVKILDITDEVQTNKEALHSVSVRAGDIVLAVSRACEGARGDTVIALGSDLQQLTGTMNDIFSFTSELVARPWYKRVLYKMEDANAIKALDTNLTHAFQVFVVQSSISLRVSQQEMTQKLADTPTVARSHLVTSTPLCVPEGVYIIRSAVDGRVLEIEHSRLRTQRPVVHAYVTPFCEGMSQYQLWMIFKREGKELRYTISSLATGAVLDVFWGQALPGTQVIGHSPHGQPVQLWAFHATRSTSTYDYCTIRSYGPPTVMDAKCPSGNDCELLHMSHLQASGLYTSQEWFLIRLPITSSVPWMMSTAPHFASNDIPRRKFWLQNVASGRYMAAIGLDGNIDDGNIALEVDSARASLWHFVVTTEGAFWQAYPEHFAIVTGMAPNLASLDHYAQRRVLANAKRYWTSDPHHMWKAIPRDGAFTFLNMASQCLLCQNRTAAVVDTAPPSTCDDPGCLWRLVDPRMGEPCRVLYDATANVVPPEIAGASEDVEESLQTVPPQILLRSQDAPADVVGRFAESLKAEHELVRGMLESGHTAVVLALRLVMGWKKGRISKIYLDDEDSTFGMPKFKGKEEFDPCPS